MQKDINLNNCLGTGQYLRGGGDHKKGGVEGGGGGDKASFTPTKRDRKSCGNAEG